MIRIRIHTAQGAQTYKFASRRKVREVYRLIANEVGSGAYTIGDFGVAPAGPRANWKKRENHQRYCRLTGSSPRLRRHLETQAAYA